MLVTYRNALRQSHTTRTVNLHVNALRTWCPWLVEEGYLANNPAARFHLVDQQEVSEHRREGLNPTQVSALLLAAGRSREKERNVAIIHLCSSVPKVEDAFQLGIDEVAKATISCLRRGACSIILYLFRDDAENI